MGIALTDTRAKITFLVLHGGAVLAAAAFGPARAVAAACVIAVLALLRYLAMAAFASWLGRSTLMSLITGSLWLAALGALVGALWAIGKAARPALPWAAASALVGPLAASLVALFRAVAALSRRADAGAVKELAP